MKYKDEFWTAAQQYTDKIHLSIYPQSFIYIKVWIITLNATVLSTFPFICIFSGDVWSGEGRHLIFSLFFFYSLSTGRLTASSSSCCRHVFNMHFEACRRLTSALSTSLSGTETSVLLVQPRYPTRFQSDGCLLCLLLAASLSIWTVIFSWPQS